jgi:hypothetical protein
MDLVILWTSCISLMRAILWTCFSRLRAGTFYIRFMNVNLRLDISEAFLEELRQEVGPNAKPTRLGPLDIGIWIERCVWWIEEQSLRSVAGDDDVFHRDLTGCHFNKSGNVDPGA